MTLLYLHQYFKFPTENGGTRSFDLAKSFVNKGYVVEIVTATSEEKYNKKERWVRIEKDDLIVNYLYLPYGNHLSYLQRSLVFLKFLWFATLKLNSLNADFVLATSTPLTIGIPALIKKWKDRTPFIFEVRDVWPEAVIAIGALNNKFFQYLLFKLEKIIYKNAFAIVPLSTDMKQSITTRFPEMKNKSVVVIENISEINRFKLADIESNDSQITISDARFSVLYAGTFGKVNGLRYVVDLAAKTLLLDPSIHFILIGEGAEKDAVIAYAKQNKVLNVNIYIRNSIAKGDLPEYYASSSMGSSFVIPVQELWANSANKFFDTLAASKPILINHEGWQAAVIREQNIGYVLPSLVDDKAASDFVNYTRNEELIKEQQINSLRIAKEKYSLEVATEKYVKIFQQVNPNV